jgi:hypothetical protein
VVTVEWSGPGSIGKMGAAVEVLALAVAETATTDATRLRVADMKISSGDLPLGFRVAARGADG